MELVELMVPEGFVECCGCAQEECSVARGEERMVVVYRKGKVIVQRAASSNILKEHYCRRMHV
jgi:hypothetical protein